MPKKIVVIGGGITGLTSAFYLEKIAERKNIQIDVTVLEAEDRFGGKIRTVNKEGFVIERGPDSFLKRKRAALELIEALGLENDVVSNNTGRAFILKSGELHPIPEASVMGVPTQLKPILSSELLSDDGKASVLNDLFIPPLPAFEDISVGSFFKKRLGKEIVDHIISPLLSGIYAGDIDKLSLSATQPQFIDVERKAGSLIMGFNGKAPKKTQSGQFATLKSGLSTLVDQLLVSIKGDCLTGANVMSIEKAEEASQYSVTLKEGKVLQADGIIMTSPVEQAAKLLPDAPFLIRESADPNTSVATIAMAFNSEDVILPEHGTGFVVSRKERVSITASTWTHLKWPHTVPDGKVLLRAYVGKAGEEHILEHSDEELVKQALEELKKVLRISGQPLFSLVSRWNEAMPQYPVGHVKWLKYIEEHMSKSYPNVYLAGASYDGVGLPDCIRQGKQRAEQIMESL